MKKSPPYPKKFSRICVLRAPKGFNEKMGVSYYKRFSRISVLRTPEGFNMSKEKTSPEKQNPGGVQYKNGRYLSALHLIYITLAAHYSFIPLMV
jgi:hypothetical protein